MSKSSLIPIVSDHFATLRDARTGALSRVDVIEQFAVPALVAGISLATGWYWGNPAGAVAGVSIVAALLCSMAVFIFQLRLEVNKIDDDRLGPEDYALLDETFSNVMWAILVGLALALYLIVCDALGLFTASLGGRLLTALGVYVAIHFLLVIGMSLKRLRRAYQRIAARQR